MSISNSSIVQAGRLILRTMSRARKAQLFAVIGLMLAGAVAELVAIGSVLPFLALLADPGRIAQIGPVNEFFSWVGADSYRERIIAGAALFAVMAIVAGLVRIQLAWSSQAFVFRLGHDVTVEIHRRVLAQPYEFHISNNTSVMIAALEKVQVLVFNVMLQLMLSVSAATISLFIIAGLIVIDPVVASVAALAFGGIYVVVSLVTRGKLSGYGRRYNAALSDRVQITQETLGAARDIILDHSQAMYLNLFSRADAELNDARAKSAFIGAAPRFVIEAVGMVLIAGLAAYLSSGRGGLGSALPVLGALALGAQRLLPLMQQIYLGWTLVTGNRAVAQEVVGLLQLPVDEANQVPPARPLPFRREIRFDDVAYAYPSRDQPALAALDFAIPFGARVAFIGKTGSGKSTLIDLLMGLLEPSSGRICVDGVELVRAARREWQANIAHVPQVIFLADVSIARNIAFGAERIDMDRVRRAARMAQLADYVEALPQGYDTSVGERGVRMSGGQRQRLGLARALYKEAAVLILDEATSALDDQTEAAVTAALAAIGREMTVIMIAHRLSTIADCDLVFRLDGGRMVQSGSVAEVVANVATPAAA